MLTIDHLHSTIRQMEHEIRRQKSKAAMLFNDVLTMKKSRRLWMHFQKNHSGWAQQVSPEPLPILPPLPSPPPVPIPGTPENPIDVDVGTRESPIEIKDNPEPVAEGNNDESDEEFPFQGRVSPSVVNDWEGRVDWSAVRRCGNCGSASHGAQWCQKGLTYDPEMGFWYTDKSGEIWPKTGAVLWLLLPILFFLHVYSPLFLSTRIDCMSFHLIISCWLMLRLDGCAHQPIAQFLLTAHSL